MYIQEMNSTGTDATFASDWNWSVGASLWWCNKCVAHIAGERHEHCEFCGRIKEQHCCCCGHSNWQYCPHCGKELR